MEALLEFIKANIMHKRLETYETLQFKFENISSEELEKLVPPEITEFFSTSIIINQQTTFKDIAKLNEYLDDIELDFTSLKNIKVVLTFDKSHLADKPHTFFFTNFKEFSNELNLNHSEFLSVFTSDSFVQNMKKINIILLDDLEKPLENEFMILSNYNNVKDDKSINENLKLKIQSYNDVFEKIDFKYIHQIPEFYYFKNSNHILLNSTFIKSFLSCVSNSHNEDEFLIKGHHNLKFKFLYNEEVDSIKMNLHINTYLNILAFLLAPEKNQERLFIFRNALTTYISNSSDLNDLNNQIINIFDTTQHHFKLFVEDELKIFLEQKNKLLDEAIKTAKQIVTFTNDLTTNIRTICLTIFGGVILKFIPKIDQLIKENSNSAVIIVIAYMLYLIINLIIICKIKDQKNNFMNNFKLYTQYMSVEDNSELSYPKLKENFLKDHEKTFMFLFILTVTLNIVFIVITFWYIIKLKYPSFLSLIANIL